MENNGFGSPNVRWAVIFDNDGVLVDSEHLAAESFRLALEEQGMTEINASPESFMGLTDADLVRVFSASGGKYLDGEKFAARKAELYFEAVRIQGLKPFQGIPELLRALKGQGVALAVASSGSREKIDVNLTATGIKEFFEVVVSGEEVMQSKPAPDVFMKAADLLNVAYDRCVVIEDSLNGLIGARRAGMKGVGFTSTFPRFTLEVCADYVADSIEEITPEMLGRLVLGDGI